MYDAGMMVRGPCPNICRLRKAEAHDKPRVACVDIIAACQDACQTGCQKTLRV